MQFHPQYQDTVRRLEEALNSPRLMVFGRINTWLEKGALPDEIIDVCTRVAKQGRWNGSTLNYFDGFIADAIAARTKPMPEAKPRVDSGWHRKADVGYQPTPDLPADMQERIERGKADMLMKGMTVMSVTPSDARRFKAKGWITAEVAERLGA